MRISYIILIAFVALIIVLIYFKISSNSNSSIQNSKKPGSGDAVMAEILVLKDTLLQYQIQSIGSVKANEEVNIVSEPAGKIRGIYFKEGNTVSKGTLLFKLDDAEYVARKKKLESEIKLASDNESRYKILKEKGGVSAQTYEEVANQLQTLKADLELINVQLSKTEIRAPFTGKVGLRNVSEGAYVTANTILTSLQDISKTKIDFTVPERYAGLLKPQQQISFTVENDSTNYSAIIVASDPSVNTSTRSLHVRAIAANYNQKLIPGMSARISITLGENIHSILVPTSALIPITSGYKAFVIKDGKAASRNLKTGERGSTTVEVIEGLIDGDSLITTNLLMMRPDLKVKPVPIK